jgi:hypothetical protein
MKKPSAFGRFFGFKKSYFGSDTAGHDVKAFGDTTGKYMEWDASTNQLNVSGVVNVTAQFVKGQKFEVTFSQIAAADVAKTFFIAPAACKVVSAYERHVTVAGQAGTLQIEKLNTGEAPGAGDVVLASAFYLTSTANTPVSKAAVTDGKESLVAGDALCLKLASGAATSYALGTLTLTMQWI